MTDSNIFFSKTRECLVGINDERKTNQPSDLRAFAEAFTNVTELNALANMIGPYGIKTINDHFSTIIWEHVERLLDMTEDLRPNLREIRKMSRREAQEVHGSNVQEGSKVKKTNSKEIFDKLCNHNVIDQCIQPLRSVFF